MNRVPWIPVLLTAWLAASGVTPAGAEESVAPAQLRAFLAETVTLEADFSQELQEAAGGRSQRSAGRFYLHRPMRFRWDYREPVSRLVVADGEHLWLYEPDLEQATVRRLDDGLSTTPAMLLSGSGRLEDSFRVGAAYREDGIDWVELAPLASSADFDAVRVGFEGGRLVAMELRDALGQATLIRFGGLRLNAAVDPALFQFVPPPGTDVLRDDEF